MTFTTFWRLLSQAVIHSRQPVALNWARNSFGLVLTVFLRKICILGIAEYFLIVLFQISEIKKDEIRFKKYIFFARYVFDCTCCRGEGSSNRNASRNESVKAGDKSVEAGDESIEAEEKTPQSCYNFWQLTRGSSRVSGICHQSYQCFSMLNVSDGTQDHLWCKDQGVLLRENISSPRLMQRAWCKRTFITKSFMSKGLLTQYTIAHIQSPHPYLQNILLR